MSRLYNITKHRVIFETQKENGLPLQMFHSIGLPVGISQIGFRVPIRRFALNTFESVV